LEYAGVARAAKRDALRTAMFATRCMVVQSVWWASVGLCRSETLSGWPVHSYDQAPREVSVVSWTLEIFHVV